VAGQQAEYTGVVLVDYGEDPPGEVTVFRLANGPLGINAGVLHVGDELLAVFVAARDLWPAAPVCIAQREWEHPSAPTWMAEEVPMRAQIGPALPQADAVMQPDGTA